MTPSDPPSPSLRPKPFLRTKARRVRPFALLLAALLAAVAVAQPLSPLPRADGGEALASDLAFVGPDGRIGWLPAGSERVRLLGDPDLQYAFPAFSPDGRRLAAIERTAARARAVVFDLPGEEGAPVPRAAWLDLPSAPVIYLDWADDGDELLLLTGDTRGFALRRATAETASEPLARGAPLFWDQRDDGLMVHVGGPGQPRLVLTDAVGRIEAELRSPGAFRAPAVSPSGDWLAYGERLPGDVRRAVIERTPTDDAAPAEGPGRRALDVRGLSAFAWHPRDDVLALTRPIASVPHSFGPLGGLDASTGLFEPWTDASVLAFWWSPAGDAIGVLALQGAPGGGSVAASGAPSLASVRPIAAAARGPVVDAPEPPMPVQAGGLRLRAGVLDPASGDVAWLGTVVPQQRFLNEQVPFFDQYARSHVVWSPDGRWWALSVVDALGRDVIGLIDVRSGTVREIAPGTAPVFAPR